MDGSQSTVLQRPAQSERNLALAPALRVLDVETRALEDLASSLDDGFLRVVEKIEAIVGRVVVTGMGKSGHVARKIAATLASTGTPAFYVHPAEASHGDLGMVTVRDAVLALSNSGETPELSDIIAYSRLNAIPLIAMTGRRDSSLAMAADHVLALPAIAEACPMGLAPTTSTTLMLALGDALAVTLLERKGFTAADFKSFHPGGQLGKRLLKVADLMHGPEHMPLVAPDMSMAEALLVMTAKSFGCVAVIDKDRLCGVITDGDLRRKMSTDFLSLTAREVMTRRPKTVAPTILAAEALHIMKTKNITSLFVVDSAGAPVGLVHIHDLLRAGIV